MAENYDDNEHWPEDGSDHESPSPGEGRSFFSIWGWPLFGLAAFVIFELTASLMWSSLVFALRFGWKDVYSGWFFWRNDTSTARGLASGLLYLTSATSRVLVAGFVVMLLLVSLNAPNGQALAPQVESAMIAMTILFLGGMFASGLCGVAALVVCRRTGQKIWVDRASYQQSILGSWPPQNCTTNRCDFICFVAMIPLSGLYLCLSLALLIPLELMDFGNGNRPDWVFFLWIAPVMCSIPFFIRGRAWLTKSMRADRPSDCWPELTTPA